MRRFFIDLVVAGLVGFSVASGATLNGVRAWAGHSGTKGPAKVLASFGVTNSADQAAIVAAWDEDTFLDVALKYRAFGLLGVVVSFDKPTATGIERIKAALLAEKVPPEATPEIVAKLPAADRAGLTAAAGAVVARRYAEQPEFGRLYLKYNVLQGGSLVSSGASEQDLTSLLLAAEPLGLREVEAAKQAIKGRAIILARAKLRADGKSFVMKDSVNPLTAKVQPVVDGLNAPACEGLEAALRALGVEVSDFDRTELLKVGETWRGQVMRGDLTDYSSSRLLGKIAIVLGADGFNRFVDEYNNGKAGGK